MTLARTFIFGFPLLVAVVAWWSAAGAMRNHAHGKDGIVVMLPQTPPVLNPFLPATEVERQITDLVHAPLLRVDEKGTLQPELADLWRWSQDVTCWFEDEAAAKRAQELLQAQIGETNRWAEWHLNAVQVRANTLLLSFGEAATTEVRHALDATAEMRPQPVAFWRVERATPLRADWDRFMSASPQARQIQRTWFDGANACEFVVTGPAQRVLDDLRAALNAGTAQACVLTLLGEAGALVEPVLDLDIRPGQVWHDGSLVTAEDARATLEFLRTCDWPLTVHEVLRQIQQMESQNDGGRLHVTFRKRHGPTLAALADLPILPAAWVRAHPHATEADFVQAAPPGAGSHRIVARDARSLILEPVEAGRGAPRFLFSFAASPLMTQIGTSTHTVDVIWPAAAADRVPQEQLRVTPPRQRLVVLWNTRAPIISNTRFRQALAMAVDPGALIEALPGRLGRADASLFAPNLWYSTHARRLPHDLEKARQILFEEGWPQDVEGVARSVDRSFRFTLLVPEGDELHQRAAEMLVAQWRKLGAVVTLDHVPDAGTLAGRLRERRFDAVLVDQRFEVSWDQSPWWHSAQDRPGGTNFCGITDPQIDLQLQALAAEFDPANVPERVRGLEARLLPLHPMLPLFTTHDEAAFVAPAPPSPPAVSASAWTLRTLAVPARSAAAAPVIDLKLRSPE